MRPTRSTRGKKRLPETDSSASGSSVNIDHSPAKVARIEEELPNGTQFLDMNDDCIEKVCDLLPLDDLCALGRTCKRIFSIAGDYFQRNYPNNHVRIQSLRRRSVFYMYPDEKYVDDLKPFIRNVSIQEYKGGACIDYLKSNFCENLREVAFYGINSELNKSHGVSFKNQLKCLESIKFVNCSVGDIYEIFLKHCSHLKHLGIDEPIQYNGGVSWEQYEYPTMKSITYFDEANTGRADFAGFLRRNPQIKNISCKGTTVHSVVFNQAKDLDYLVLCYNSEKDFNRNCKLAKLYSEQSQTKRIKIEFKKRLELEHITKVAAIQRVHEYRGYLVENLQCPEILSTMEHLRVLQLQSFGNVSQVYVKRLANSVPNLEELHFASIECPLSLKNLLMPFCHNLNLKKIVISTKQVIYRCTKSDISDIAKVRETLSTKAKLDIYMRKEVIDSMKFKIPPNCKVSVKRLSQLKRELLSLDI